MKRLPNILTFTRLFLVPLMAIFMLFPYSPYIYIAMALFIIAGLTDFVDGYFARKYDAVTDLGKILDPIADKLLVMITLIMFLGIKTGNGGRPWVSVILVAIIFAREIWIMGLRTVASAKGVVVPASKVAKYKTTFQMIAIGFLFLSNYTFPFLLWDCCTIGNFLLLISTILSVISAVDYSKRILSL
ncbi:MAG: CDP-diacylglycerol--glycerol-3-phosphate 3-phosphatidyltransferase [Bdellovibrionota bacterium]